MRPYPVKKSKTFHGPSGRPIKTGIPAVKLENTHIQCRLIRRGGYLGSEKKPAKNKNISNKRFLFSKRNYYRPIDLS